MRLVPCCEAGVDPGLTPETRGLWHKTCKRNKLHCQMDGEAPDLPIYCGCLMVKHRSSGRPLGFDSESEEALNTPDRILEAAAELVSESSEGADDVTVTEIAKRARVSAAQVHNYFGNAAKAKIIGFICKRFVGQASQMMELGLYFLRDGSPVDQLVSVLQATLRVFGMMESYGRVVFKEMSDLDPDSELTKPFFKVFDRVDAIIKEGQAKGEIRTDLDAGIIRQGLFYYTLGLLIVRYRPQGPDHPQTQLTDERISTEVLRVLDLHCIDPRVKSKLASLMKANDTSPRV